MKMFFLGLMCCVLSSCASMSITQSDSASISEQFDTIRHQTPKLTAFMNDFPKGADLHNHASGAVYIDDALIFAVKNGYFYDIKKLKIVAKNNKEKTLISVKELLKRKNNLEDFLNIVSARGWHRNTINGSDHFFSAFAHLNVDGQLHGALARILARNHSQGVRYVELMSSMLTPELVQPMYEALPETSFNMNNLSNAYSQIEKYLHSAQFAEGVNSIMDERGKAVDAILQKNYGLTITGDTPDIVVRYIPQLARSKSPYVTFIMAAANFQASNIDENIVATNMVEVEASFFSSMYFDDQMKILDFLWQTLDKPNVALHAGELVLRESPVEAMRSRISKSIEIGHASRIGHGISIAWEENPEATLKMMRDNGIAIEICLSSNDMILGITGDDHPLDMYLDAGVPVTLSTDDEGISRSNLTWEYVRAAQEHGLSYQELKKIAKNGLEYSFLDGEGIYDADGNVLEKYQAYLLNSLPTVANVGMKAYLQIRYERDLLRFENEIQWVF